MNLIDVMRLGVIPALEMLPPHFDTPDARTLMLAIGLQESRFKYRRQMGNGPARSFYQFEERGGVLGILTHSASKTHMMRVCNIRNVPFKTRDVWVAMEHDDVLAAFCCRMLLWTDPRPLPQAADRDGGWAYYIRNWQPGKPHPASWPDLHNKARLFIDNSLPLP